MLTHAKIPILGFAAFSGTGKTTLLLTLLPRLKEHGLRLGMIKHAHHSFEIDRPGKDSFRLRQAGATRMLVGSRHRWAMITETPNQEEPQLNELLRHFPQDDIDLLLVEGFKHESFPKIELHRPALAHPLLFPDDPDIIAIATDAAIGKDIHLPVLNLNKPEQIYRFIVHWYSNPENIQTWHSEIAAE